MLTFLEDLQEILKINGLDKDNNIKEYLKVIEANLEKSRKVNLDIENRENKEMSDIYNYDLIFKYITDTQNDNS
jgi:predicted DNA-binding ArsR family transcriptional regulator